MCRYYLEHIPEAPFFQQKNKKEKLKILYDRYSELFFQAHIPYMSIFGIKLKLIFFFPFWNTQ